MQLLQRPEQLKRRNVSEPQPHSEPHSQSGGDDAGRDQLAEDGVDQGGRSVTRVTTRRCIVTREPEETDKLLRFVIGPDGAVVPDLKLRLPGRGAWVTAKAAKVREAAQKGYFSRALKTKAKAAKDLDQEVAALLLARALDALGLAAKQGEVVSGFSKVDAGARSGQLGLVFFAKDGAVDSRRKLDAGLLAGQEARRNGTMFLYSGFTSEQMNLALGRANVIHAGIATGRVAAAVTKAVRRLDNYCDEEALKSLVA